MSSSLEKENAILKNKLSRIFAIMIEEYIEEHYKSDGIVLTLEDFITMHRENINIGV